MHTKLPFSLLLASCLGFLVGIGPAVAAAPAAPVGPEVTVMEIVTRPTRLSFDIVGEIKAYREVDLRARVGGNLLEIAFTPGQKVAEGDLLFVIDPGPYQIDLANAEARVAQARASLAKTRQDVERYRPLLPDNAIPRQVFDQAVAQATQEEAVVAGYQAAADRARLDLGYTRVKSPLSGKVGLQKVEVGTLIAAGQTSLATVSTLDPVAVYFSIAETDYLNYVRMREKEREKEKEKGTAPSRVRKGSLPVELLLADGSVYEEAGRIDYIDPVVNPTTGTLTLRALFANPLDLLKPGMNSRIRIYYSTLDEAILVPQKVVTETLGRYFVTVVGEANKAEMRPVRLGVRLGDSWLVEEGLRPGERIVVDGIQKARPGTTVLPVPLPGSGQSGK